MPYYIIGGHPVFMTWARDRELVRGMPTAKDALSAVGRHVSGTKESEEREEYIFKLLQELYARNPDAFVKEWVNFDMGGDEASANIFDLLYDYCHYYGFAHLSDLRDFSEKLIADYKGELYARPMGEVFALDHFVKPARWWWRYSRKMQSRTVRCIINSRKVTRIRGNLTSFEVRFDGYKVRCGKDLEVASL